MPPDRKTGLVGAEGRRERVRLPARRVAWTPGRLPRADVLTAGMIRKKPAPHLMRGGYRFERPGALDNKPIMPRLLAGRKDPCAGSRPAGPPWRRQEMLDWPALTSERRQFPPGK